MSDLSLGTGMNGWGLVRAVRTQWPQIGLILTTGSVTGLTDEQVTTAGADAVLLKPFSSTSLRDLVARVARQRRR